MTIREMYKKVEAYNEIAEIWGEEKLSVGVDVGTVGGLKIREDTYADFLKVLRREVVKDLADKIIKCNKFSLEGEYVEITWADWDNEYKEEVDAFICQ